MCPSNRNAGAEAVACDFRAAFDVIDADHDGRIGADDLKIFYSSVPSDAAATDDEIRSMISAADADRDGFVGFQEFERVLAGGGGGEEGKIMEAAFRVMDRDGDGRVGFEDLKAYLGMIGTEVGDEDVKMMLRMGGGDERDGVGFDALLKILAIDFLKAF